MRATRTHRQLPIFYAGTHQLLRRLHLILEKIMAKIINLGYTSSLDNKGIILTGKDDESFETEKDALESARFLINENPDGSDIYVWQDSDDNWNVGW